MKLAIFALIGICAIAVHCNAAALSPNEWRVYEKAQWRLFKLNFNRSYPTTEEELFRRGIFNFNLKTIYEHNKKFERGETTYTMGVNDFTDLTSEEVKQHMGLIMPDVPAMQTSVDVEWENFKTQFGKSYASAEEEQMRKQIFSKNLEKINAHNKRYDNHEVTWQMRVNKFTDWTHQEFKEWIEEWMTPAMQTSVDVEWENFKTQFGKSYASTEEEQMRKQIFNKNLEKINAHNKRYDNHEVTWQMRVNKFTDWTHQEFKEWIEEWMTPIMQTSVDVEWENFKTQFGKSYASTEEEQMRKQIFNKNLEKINAHNKRYDNHEVTWQMRVNKFTDWTHQEFKEWIEEWMTPIMQTSVDVEWENFKTQFGKSYASTEEEQMRKQIFSKNLEKINAHNKRYDNHEVTWRMGVNDFTDLTAEEVRERLGIKFEINRPMGVSESSIDEEWEKFKAAFGKLYESAEEEQKRKQIFSDNLDAINAHNEKYNKNEVSWQMGVNKFTDWTHQEFKEWIEGSRTLKAPQRSLEEVPDSVNWVEYGFDTTVKQQGTCGSCYAMAVTEAIEAQWYLKHKEFIALSQQELVDCTLAFGNMGCQYGDLNNTFTYIKMNGVGTYDKNPYLERVSQCRQETPRYFITGWHQTEAEDEEDLKQAVAKGPVIAVISTGLYSFQTYSSGVYYDEQCQIDPTSVNHFVLVVGYGTTQSGVDYWLIKNSWGKTWGAAGYMKMARNRGNLCGIATEAMYPDIE